LTCNDYCYHREVAIIVVLPVKIPGARSAQEGPGNRAGGLFSRQDCYLVGRTNIWVKYFCVKGKIFFLGKFSNFGMKN
jgi:hypothetical protein